MPASWHFLDYEDERKNKWNCHCLDFRNQHRLCFWEVVGVGFGFGFGFWLVGVSFGFGKGCLGVFLKDVCFELFGVFFRDNTISIL